MPALAEAAGAAPVASPAEAPAPARRKRRPSRRRSSAAAGAAPVSAAPASATAPAPGSLPEAVTEAATPVPSVLASEVAAPAAPPRRRAAGRRRAPAAAEREAVPEAPAPAPPERAPAAELPGEEQVRLDTLAKRLQIGFRRPELLREAMTHASWNNERGEPSGPGRDNERLEYLGDAVLELIVGEYLFRRFPGYDEGQLTQLRAALVNTLTLAKLAERLGLGETLLLGKGQAKTGGRQLPSLLANSFEAMIGAIFLDQGYRVATRVFLQSIGDLAEWSDQNHKGKLQEVAQVRLGATPSYRVVSLGGPGHRREYRAEAMVGGKALGEGRGSTKQAAEQAAAEMALARISPAGPAPEKAGGGAGEPARVRRRVTEAAAEPAQPARVRRRVTEVAADRRVVTPERPPVAAHPASGDGGGGASRGLFAAIRAAAEALLGRRTEADLPVATERPASTSRRRTRRGHRGGRGRRPPQAGSPPAG